MRIGVTISVSTVLLAGVVWLSTASAQQGDRSPTADSLKESEQFSLLDEDIESLSMSQMQRRARNKVDKIRSRLKQTQRLLERTRAREKDVAKANCINKNMATMKGFVKISGDSYQNLQKAVQKGDRSSASHYYKLIAVAGRKTAKLRSDTQLCTGQSDQYAGETDVDVEVSERVRRHRLSDEFDDREGALEEDEDDGGGGSGHPSSRALPELSPYQ